MSTQDIEPTIQELVEFYGDGGLCPTQQQWKEVLEKAGGSKICVVNFMKINETANYADQPGADIPGIQALMQYGLASQQCIESAGGTIIFQGAFNNVVIGDDEDWNIVIVVEYPNRNSFLSLFQDPDYRAAHHHRIAAVEKHKMILASGF